MTGRSADFQSAVSQNCILLAWKIHSAAKAETKPKQSQRREERGECKQRRTSASFAPRRL